MYRVKKINDVVVKPPKALLDNQDNRPVKGAKMIAEPYANIFLCARKKSGKTVTIHNILKNCVGRDSTVVFFCSTLYKDPVYRNMMKMLKDNGINFIGYTSLKEGDIDHLNDLVDCLEMKAQEEFDLDDEPKTSKRDLCHALFDSDDEEDDEPKKRKTKYLAPEYIIILDDLADELKSKSLVTLLKKNRHWKMKIIIASQWLNDLLPECRKQLDYILIFKNIPDKKLEEIHTGCNLAIDFEEFVKIYKWATQPQYSFLYIDCINDQFRRNFNMLIESK